MKREMQRKGGLPVVLIRLRWVADLPNGGDDHSQAEEDAHASPEAYFRRCGTASSYVLTRDKPVDVPADKNEGENHS